MVNIGGGLAKNPFNLVTMLIGIAILASVAIALYHTMITSITSLSTMDNFTFASLFGDSSVVQIILSALVLIGILAIVGVKVASSKGR